jgi:iron complex outermembrane receptor protein
MGGPGEVAVKSFGYYVYGEFENSGSYYDNSGSEQSLYQASFDMNINDSVRVEFGGMYQDFNGNQVAGWNRLTQDLIDHGTYITGSPTNLDTNGDGYLSADESKAGNLSAFIFGPSVTSAADIQAALAANPNMALQNPGTTHLKGNQVLVQEDDVLEDQVTTLYFDTIASVTDAFKVTNKVFYENLDNNNENIYGFSQFAKTWVAEDQLILAYSTDQMSGFQGNFQVSPSIRHQDFEHGDNFEYEYFDRRDITLPGSPIDRRGLATRGQELYSSHTVGDYTDYAIAGLADVTLFDHLNIIVGGRYDYLDMKSETLPDSLDPALKADDTDGAVSWSASVSYELPLGIRPYATYAKQSTLILGQGGQIPTSLLADGNAIGDSKLKEVGIKSSLLNNHMYLALDYFEQERVDFNAQDTVTNNSTEAKGYEFEARWVVNPVVTFTAAYTNLKVYNISAEKAGTQFSFAGAADLQGVDPSLIYGGVVPSIVLVGDREASRKAGIPENVLSIYALFSATGAFDGLTGTIGVTDVDSVYSGFSKTVKLPAYTLLNASIYYETKNWKVGLQGKNLTDERYFRSNFPDLFGSSVVLPELPRNYLVSASYKF